MAHQGKLGLLAHPVERFHGMEEASGSSPLESTEYSSRPQETLFDYCLGLGHKIY